MIEDVINILCEQLSLSVDEVAFDSDITGELGADSLDIIELVDKFEKKYDMTISDEEIMEISTVEDIVNYIKNHLV